MITILVPTLNRPEYINRLLKYYSRCSFEGKIIIGDSSNEENSELNQKMIDETQLDIEYIHSPPGDYYQTLREMIIM